MRAMRLASARRPLRGNGFTAIASGGTGQTGVCGSALAVAFSVTVKNASGALASGVQVLWDSTADGSMSTTSGTTDGSGVASSTLTLGSVAGTQTATATVIGVGVITFTCTATAVAVATFLLPNSTLDQTGSTSSTVAAPPSVLVTDQFGNPFAGKTVTFAVTAGGGSRSPATVDTGADGIATLDSWTLGGSVGANTLTATVAGLTGSPITFNAAGVAATPTQIAVTAGGSQTGVVAGQAASAITVRVRDGSNNNLQGVLVSFSTNLGSLSAATGTTDASGLASVTLTTDTTVGTATVTASVLSGTISTSTTVASTFGTATKAVIQTQAASNGSSGTALPGQPIIRITDANGNTVTSGASSTLTVTATITGGNATPSGNTKAAVAGVATFTAFAITDIDGGVNIPTYTPTGLTGAVGTGITVAPPLPDHPAFGGTVSGAQVGQSIAAFTVEIRDSSNGVVPGATNAVTITLTGAPGVVLGGTTTVNAVAGIATFSGLTVDTAGSYTFTATSVGLATETAVSNSFTISVVGATNKPLDVTMVRYINGDLSAEALNTQFTNNSSHFGGTISTAVPPGSTPAQTSDFKVRLLSEQQGGVAWLPTGPALIPACPNGIDRVLVCKFGGSGVVLKPGEYGKLFVTPPSAKTLYGIFYALVSSQYIGEATGSFKRFYFRNASTQPAVFLFNGAGSNALNMKINWQSPNTSAKLPGSGISMTRNVWALWEFVAVCASSNGAADGHLTIFKDGSRVYQRTDMITNNTTWSESQFLNFLGGTNDTTFGASNGPNLSLTGSGFEFYYSTSRAAVPA